MSIRVIASVGVMLCIAVTTLALYLGVAEHVGLPLAAQPLTLRQTATHHLVCDARDGVFRPTDKQASVVADRCKSLAETLF